MQQTTGFKYQMISCKTGYEIIDVTLNHLESIRGMVTGDVVHLVDECTRRVHSVYHSLSGLARNPCLCPRPVSSSTECTARRPALPFHPEFCTCLW
jgi:hypothetical protein